MLLRNKIAIITGSSTGIGRAIALAYARAGCAVVVDHVGDGENAAQVVDRIHAEGGTAMAVQADISVLTDVERLLAACMRQFAVPDILVNNAGIEPRTSLLECTEEQFDRTLAVDLKGAFFCTQYVARELVRSRKKGRIINISSVHEERPMPGNTAYCCAKGGMRMLTRTAGLELAPHGIGVIGIAPGAVDTPMNAVTLNDDLARAALTRSIPLGRVASPEEIAGLAVWLASEEADYITATTIYMDGGLLQASTGL